MSLQGQDASSLEVAITFFKSLEGRHIRNTPGVFIYPDLPFIQSVEVLLIGGCVLRIGDSNKLIDKPFVSDCMAPCFVSLSA